jgi:hypothetical protein
LTNYETELILDSESEASDENSDETYGEEVDMKEQAPIPPCRRVYKRGCVTDQSAERVHNNTDDSSDHEVIPAPFVSQGVSKWGQLTGQTNTNIFQFVGVWYKTECGTPYK